MEQLLVGVQSKEIWVGCQKKDSLTVHLKFWELHQISWQNLELNPLLVIWNLDVLNVDFKLLTEHVALIFRKHYLDLISH